VLIITLFMLPVVVSQDSSIIPITDNGNLTYSIWDYSNTVNEPTKALYLELDLQQWQAFGAICSVPAFFGRSRAVPLLFSDGSGGQKLYGSYDEKKVTDFGTTAESVSKKIATDYWSKAELVFVVENYEQGLWVIPSASFYGAPILVSPSKETLAALGTKCAVVVGNSNIDVEESIKLKNMEDVWDFQLELFDSKGVNCDYVILTNPRDTEDTTPENIKWTFQSPAAAILAAYRRALVVTGDWSMDRKAFEAVESTSSPDNTNYEKIKPSFTQLKQDSDKAINKLENEGHEPEFLAAVGGPYAVPNYVYNIHVDYKYPLGTPAKTQYPSSLAAYATTSQTIDSTRYSKEDLAAGRLAAGNIFDLTNQLMRTFFYKDYLPGGKHYSNTPSGWEKKGVLVDGHRLNQPEPNNLIWDPNEPYYPYEGVNPAMKDAGLATSYYLPRNESDPYDTNETIETIMQTTSNYGYFHFMPHGGLTNLRIEVGNDNITGRQNVFLEASTISELEYIAPTMIYTTCCKGGVWMLDSGYEPSDFITSSFIHAGAVAYLATPEIQSTCFWDEAPLGTATEQAINFWDKVLSENVPIGVAFRDAKWSAFQSWLSKSPDPSSPKTHHVDGISYTLFGDPALELYKPNVPFKDIKELDVNVQVQELKTEEDFTVTVTVTDLATGTTISDPIIKIIFDNAEQIGSSVSFTAPKDVGDMELLISVAKTGYETAELQAWVQVEKAEEKGDGKGFIPGFSSIIFMSAIAIIITIGLRKKLNY
jgi:hypothetical protein